LASFLPFLNTGVTFANFQSSGISVKNDAMQFGFMPGKVTTDAIFTVRHMQEKYGRKGNKLYFAFVDLEKAFDRVPREATRWALRNPFM